jgi:hypothetical protein
VAIISIPALAASQTGGKPEEELAGIVKTYLGLGLPTDWDGLDKLPNARWAPLPPSMLKNCLPDGGCFARQGTVVVGGKTLALIATGARTMVLNVYFRNPGAPLGEESVVAALKQAGLTAELARCPVRGGAGSTNWYRLKGAKLAAGFLSFQAVRGPRPSEGLVLSHGDELPPLQPNQVAMYSEKCGAGAEQKPVATAKPHERLAEVVVALLGQAAGPAFYDWKALKDLPTEVTWNPPYKGSPEPGDDPNPVWQSGNATWAGRKFSVLGIGNATQVRRITLEEGGMHPRGEHMLGVVYEKGITVRLVRCGPVYTGSTNNWYSLVSAKTRPAMIRQSIRYEGNQVQDSYELRLDGTLPARDPRDRDPGAQGCQ